MFTVIACVLSTTLQTWNYWSKYSNLIIFNCTNLYTHLCITISWNYGLLLSVSTSSVRWHAGSSYTIILFEICTLFRFYAEWKVSFLPTSWYNILVPLSRVNQPKLFLDCLTLEHGTNRLSQMLAGKYHSTLSKIPKQCRSHLRCSGSLKLRIILFLWQDSLSYEQQSKFVWKCWSAKQSAVLLLVVRYKKILKGTGRQRLTQELASINSSDILWNSSKRTVTLRKL
jgi:hypothetical protein